MKKHTDYIDATEGALLHERLHAGLFGGRAHLLLEVVVIGFRLLHRLEFLSKDLLLLNHFLRDLLLGGLRQ